MPDNTSRNVSHRPRAVGLPGDSKTRPTKKWVTDQLKKSEGIGKLVSERITEKKRNGVNDSRNPGKHTVKSGIAMDNPLPLR